MSTVSAVSCPACGRGSVLAFPEVAYVVTAIGAGAFHVGAPFGPSSVIPDTARAMCNSQWCTWTGTLRDAIPDRVDPARGIVNREETP